MDEKGLFDVRKVQIVVEFGCGPDFAGFDSSAIRRVALDKIGVLPVVKIRSNVFKESELVVFDGEVVMGSALGVHIVGDLALGLESKKSRFCPLSRLKTEAAH